MPEHNTPTGPSETPSESMPDYDKNASAINARDAGADVVYERMNEIAKSDPVMAELLAANNSAKIQTAVEPVVNENVTKASEKMTEVTSRLASIESARLTLHPDGSVEVEAPVNKIAELLRAVKERQWTV